MIDDSEDSKSDFDFKLLQKDVEALSKKIDHAVEISESKYLRHSDAIKYGLPIAAAVCFAAGVIGWNVWDANKIREEFQKKYDNYVEQLKNDYDKKLKTIADDQTKKFDEQIKKMDEQSSNLANAAKEKIGKKLEDSEKKLDDQLQKTAEKFDNELQNKQKQLKEDLEKNFNSTANKQFNDSLVKKFGNNYKKAIDRILEAVENFSVDSGLATCDDKDIEKKKDGENNEIYSKYIRYNHKFSRKPFVLISVNGLVTTTKDDKLGLWAKADDSSISKAGFQLIVKTSFKNSTSECKIHWLAIDQFSGKNYDFLKNSDSPEP